MEPQIETKSPEVCAVNQAASPSKVTVANAFSIQMLGEVAEGEPVGLSLTKITAAEAAKLIHGATELVSALGHADTATIVSGQVGTYLPQNRISVELTPGSTLIVAQVVGGRLPEGATELPAGTSIQYWKVGRCAADLSHERAATEIALRELAPEQFWAGRIHCPVGTSREALRAVIEEYARSTGVTIAGFLREDQPQNLTFEITRYPRRAFGPVAPIESFEAHLAALGRQLGATVENPQFLNRGFRIVLGLVEGYEKPAVTHTPDEVQSKLGACDRITPVSIFAAGTWGTYEEGAVLIEGALSELPNALRVADSFRQARVCVERIGPDGGTASMVEFTQWCKDPDSN